MRAEYETMPVVGRVRRALAGARRFNDPEALDEFLRRSSDVEVYYGDNTIAVDVSRSKYLAPGEKGPLDMWDRVARAMASVEQDPEAMYSRFMPLLADFKFVPGGRILHAAGRDDAKRKPTLSNCYVIPINEDSLEGIYQCLTESAMVYRTGGGTGTDLSVLRPRGAPVNATVDTSPGVTAFMSLLSESTNTVAQAGRRGALMLTLRVDHPDVYYPEYDPNNPKTGGPDFIRIKNDSKRTRVQYANISVLLTHEFMRAVENDTDFDLRWGGKVYRTVKARDLWNTIITNAHASAEPGIIFWDTMREYHNVEYANPLSCTNPCVVGSTLVSTSKGLERIDNLVGKEVDIVTAVNFSRNGLIQKKVTKRRINGSFRTGRKFTYKLITKSGYELVVTEDHKVLTLEGWKTLRDLKIGERVLLQEGKSLFNQDSSLPFSEGKWSRELGIMLGWLIGDGWFISKGKNCRAGFVFGKSTVSYLEEVKKTFNRIYGRDIKESIRKNGAVHLSYHSKRFINFLEKLGLKQAKAAQKRVPKSIFTAPEEAVIGFLQALFSTDGTINVGKNETRYIRLSSKSEKLLKDVQLLLLNLGIRSKIYERHRNKRVSFRYKNVRGEIRLYESDGILYELQISKSMIPLFLNEIGFLYNIHSEKIKRLRESRYYKTDFTDEVVAIEDCGWEDVYDLTEPITHSFVGNGLIIHNCGEQPLASYTACNLGNLNLLAFVSEWGQLDFEELASATRTATRFLDDVIDYNLNNHALPAIRDAVASDRRVGLGVTGLADALVKMGIKYDSEEGLKTVEEAIMVIAYTAYDESVELAKERGRFSLFNWEGLSQSKFIQSLPEGLLAKIKEHGLRNSTLITMPPVGTGSIISQTTSGIEPIFDTSYKRRVKQQDGGTFREYKVYHPLVKALFGGDENLPEYVVTAHDIDPFFRVRMQGIIQKYVDSSISSTINLPQDVSVQTVADIYMAAYRQGLKGVTVYREGSREGILQTEGHVKGDSKPLEEKVRREPIKVPGIIPSIKVRQPTHAGNIHLELVVDPFEGYKPVEVFAQLGNAGTEEAAAMEALGRLTSYIVRQGHPIEDVIAQLKDIGSGAGVSTRDGGINSLPQGFARALIRIMTASQMYDIRDILLGKVNLEELDGRVSDFLRTGEDVYEQRRLPEEISNSSKEKDATANNGNGRKSVFSSNCPECGSSLAHETSCLICKNCGWSKC